MLRSRAWIPVAALAGVLAVAVVWRSADLPSNDRSGWANRADDPVPALSDSLLANSFDEPIAIDADEATLIGFDPLLEGETVHADAVDVPVPLALPSASVHSTPGTLPLSAAAQPIDIPTAHAEQQLDELIARELANLPEQQRAVWREVLQGLPAKEAEEILQIWKLTGRSDAAYAPPLWSTETLLPIPVPTSEGEPAAIPPEVAEVVRRNLKHLDTPGYLRREPINPGHEGPLLDLTPGEIRRTDNPLHLAISGPGFFCLQREKHTAFTRCGRFELSSHGELVMRRTDGDWSLSPAIQIPPDAVQFQVTEAGDVRVRRRASPANWETCGQLVLAVFINPQQLGTFDAELLTPTEKSGAPFTAAPRDIGPTRLLHYSLEMSNATLETETALLDRCERRSALLQRITSGSSQRSIAQ